MTSKDVPDPVALLQGYADRLRALEKDVKALEAKAKRLSKQYDETTSKRDEISEDIRGVQQAIDALYAERSSLKDQYADAVFESNEEELSRIASRRNEIDEQLKARQEALEELQGELNAHRVDEYGIAEATLHAEELKPGVAASFAVEMRSVLLKHQTALSSRISSAKKLLDGKASAQVIESVRMEDEEYREKKARQEQERERTKALADRRDRDAAIPEVRHVRVVNPATGYVEGYDLLDREGNKVGFKTRQEVYQDA